MGSILIRGSPIQPQRTAEMREWGSEGEEGAWEGVEAANVKKILPSF